MRAAMGLGQLGSDIQSQDGNTAVIFGEKLRDGKFEFKDDKTLQKEAKKRQRKRTCIGTRVSYQHKKIINIS